MYLGRETKARSVGDHRDSILCLACLGCRAAGHRRGQSPHMLPGYPPGSECLSHHLLGDRAFSSSRACTWEPIAVILDCRTEGQVRDREKVLWRMCGLSRRVHSDFSGHRSLKGSGLLTNSPPSLALLPPDGSVGPPDNHVPLGGGSGQLPEWSGPPSVWTGCSL